MTRIIKKNNLSFSKKVAYCSITVETKTHFFTLIIFYLIIGNTTQTLFKILMCVQCKRKYKSRLKYLARELLYVQYFNCSVCLISSLTTKLG